MNELLPIGTVVLLKNSQKRVMIVGLYQKGGKEPTRVWDYAGVIFPEGYIDGEHLLLFNNDQIVQIFAIGYQDVEQINFLTKANETIQKLRAK